MPFRSIVPSKRTFDAYFEQYFGSADAAAYSLADSLLSSVGVDDGETKKIISESQLLRVPARVAQQVAAAAAQKLSPPPSPSLAPTAGDGPSCPLLLELPPDVLDALLDSRPTSDLIALAPTCKALRAVVDDPQRWRARGRRRFSAVCDFLGLDPATTIVDKASYFELESGWLQRAGALGRQLLKIGGHVYDVTPFVDSHPGGPGLLLAAAGGDATRAWEVRCAFFLLRACSRLARSRDRFFFAARRGARTPASHRERRAFSCAQYVQHSEQARAILMAHARPDLDLEPEGTLRSTLLQCTALTEEEEACHSEAGGGVGRRRSHERSLERLDRPERLERGGWAWERMQLRMLERLPAKALQALEKFDNKIHDLMMSTIDGHTLASTRHTQCLRLLEGWWSGD